MAGKKETIAEIMNNIRRVFQAVNDKSKQAERETGITGPQLWAIKVIGEMRTLSVSDLAARMYLNPSTVVRILDRLEARGLVERNRSGTDRRIVQVQLTSAGKDLLVKAPEVASGLLVSGLETLSARELSTIDASLNELVTLLGAQKLPPHLVPYGTSEAKKQKKTKKD